MKQNQQDKVLVYTRGTILKESTPEGTTANSQTSDSLNTNSLVCHQRELVCLASWKVFFFFTLFNLLVHTRVNLGWKSAIEGGMENDVDPCCIEQDFVAYDGAHIWRAVLLVDDEGEVCYVHIKGHCKALLTW